MAENTPTPYQDIYSEKNPSVHLGLFGAIIGAFDKAAYLWQSGANQLPGKLTIGKVRL